MSGQPIPQTPVPLIYGFLFAGLKGKPMGIFISFDHQGPRLFLGGGTFWGVG